MITLTPLFAAGVVLVVVGLAGMMARRSLLSIAPSALMALLGPPLMFAELSAARQDPAGSAHAIVLLGVGGLLVIAVSAVTIAVYRRRGTVRVDELRELRG